MLKLFAPCLRSGPHGNHGSGARNGRGNGSGHGDAVVVVGTRGKVSVLTADTAGRVCCTDYEVCFVSSVSPDFFGSFWGVNLFPQNYLNIALF